MRRPGGGGSSKGKNEWGTSNVRAVIDCNLCSKQRCIFSMKRLGRSALKRLRGVLENVQYVCGSPLFDPDVSEGDEEVQMLRNEVYTKPKLDCGMDMETQFFSCVAGGRRTEVCGVCGLDEYDLLCPPEEDVLQYSKVFSICTACKTLGRGFPHSKKRPSGGRRGSGPAPKRRGRGRGRGRSGDSARGGDEEIEFETGAEEEIEEEDTAEDLSEESE